MRCFTFNARFLTEYKESFFFHNIFGGVENGKKRRGYKLSLKEKNKENKQRESVSLSL